MPNTTTPASVASRLTDEEILLNASLVDEMSYDCEIGTFGGFACGDNSPNTEEVSAVLRDYVRMRKLANAVIDRIKRYHANLENPMCAFNDIKCAVAEAEKGGAE